MIISKIKNLIFIQINSKNANISTILFKQLHKKIPFYENFHLLIKINRYLTK